MPPNTLFLPVRVGWFALSATLYAVLGYGVLREQFPTLFLLYGLLFWGYWLRIRSLIGANPIETGDPTAPPPPDRFLFGAAIACRLLLLGAMPHLSDDYARFIWDGRLLAHGYNPYLYLPATLVATRVAAVAGLTTDLFHALNSPNYYTVYPPVGQALFGLAAWLSPGSVLGNVVGLRVPILLAEIGTMWLLVKLLRRAGQNPNLALLYGLNPLVILELTGNVHAEAILIFFVLGAVWLFGRGLFVASAGALALAIGTKLLPLLLLPLVMRNLGWQRGLAYAGLTGAFTVLLFLPFVNAELVQNVGASLRLYVQNFEFNASVYYLVRAAGYQFLGFNIIAVAGVGLSVVTLAGVVWVARRWGRVAPVHALLLTVTGYFLLATTVHPWYITSLVAVGVFVPFRYPLVWSGVVWLSYATYQTSPYHENLWLTGLEYAVVLGFMIPAILNNTGNKPLL